MLSSCRTFHINERQWLSCVDPTRSPGELTIGAGPCMQTYHAQQWRHTGQGRIQQDDFCMTLMSLSVGSPVIQNLCGQQEDKLDIQGFKKVIPSKKVRDRTGLRGVLYRNIKHDLCLDTSQIGDQGLRVLRCDMESPSQRFTFQFNSH